MKKIIRLTEDDLTNLVRKILNEKKENEIVNCDEIKSLVKQYEKKLNEILDKIYTKKFDKISNQKLNKLLFLSTEVNNEYEKLRDRIFNEMKNEPKEALWVEFDKIEPLFHLNNRIETEIYELKDYLR